MSRKFRLQACFADEFFLTNQSVQSLIARHNKELASDLHAVLGILNSRLLSWFFCQTNLVSRRDDFPKTIIKQTREFPFPEVDRVSEPGLAKLVKKMLMAKKAEGESEGAQHEHWVRQSESLDRQIDQAVYELYGLTKEEIALVEN